ncbi:hypothetical protein J6590_090560, partial [Homalodisca vitripennis]
MSVFYYFLLAYGNSISRESIGIIQKLQNSAITLIFNLRGIDHISPFRNSVKLLPVEALCRLLTSEGGAP